MTAVPTIEAYAAARAVAAEAPPAGGAAIGDILVVAGFTALIYAAVLWVVVRERTGHATVVGRAADAVARLDGGPRWFALPVAVSVAGAITGATGLYWDVSYHIAEGRDAGPLSNPAHYPVFLGLVTIFVGGALALALADDRLPRRTLRLARGWQVPLGPAIGTAVAMFALLGFPLDDFWHRLFGQDVTEWGPTHVLMIGGTIMLPYAMLLTCAEARQVGGSRSRAAFEAIAILIMAAGPVAFLLEYSYGVPQFPLVNDAVVTTVAAVGTFTIAMYRGVRWVVGIWLAYAVLETVLVVLNVWVYDALVPWPSLLVGGAAVAALLAGRARPTPTFGAGAGFAMAVGTLAAEYFWTQVTRPMPWPVEMMPWAVLFAGLTGAGVGVIGTWIHQQLSTVAEVPADTTAAAPAANAHSGRWALAGLLTVLAVFAVNVPPSTPAPATVDVALGEVRDGRAHLTVRTDPVTVEDAYWFQALAWQGGGLVRADLEPAGDGTWRTEAPVPVDGRWKTMIRLHTPLHQLSAAPVHMPADPAVPAEAFPPRSGERELVEEKLILRREERHDAPTWMWATGYSVVGMLFAALFATVAVGYTLAGRGRPGGPGGPSGARAGRTPAVARRLVGARA